MYFRKGASNAEIIYKTGMHELTHAIENTKHYAYVSNYVLNKKFGGVESDKYKKAIAAKIAEYGKNGATLNEDEARSELIVGSLRETVFASGEDVRRIVEQDYTFAQHVHDWIDSVLYWVKNTFGDMDEKAQLQADLEQAQRKYRLALASVKGVRGDGNKNAYKFVGTYHDGRKVYKTNYPKGTENRLKRQDIIDVVQNVWSKNPITLTVVDGETPKSIIAKFDPALEERSDLAKIALGNKKGSAAERRMTLDLSTDLYQIASESRYDGSKSESGKKSVAHVGVKNWLYFVTDLIYEDADGKHIPSHMVIDVKSKNDGEYFYSFAIKKGAAPQTLLAAVTGRKPETTPNNNVPHPDPTVKNQMSFSSPKSDNAPAGVEDFDVKANSEVSPELQKQLDDHVFNVQSDGSVRTLAQERMEQAQRKYRLALASVKGMRGSTKSTGIQFATSLKNYPYNMQTVIKEYIDSVDKDLVDFVLDAQAETDKKRLEWMHRYIEGMSASCRERIKKLTGVDVSDFLVRTNGESVRHTDIRHGKFGKHNQSMSDVNDIARVGYILKHFDGVKLTRNLKGEQVFDRQYRNSDNTPSKVVSIYKKVNGTYYVITAVPDSAAKTMQIKSMYFTQKKNLSKSWMKKSPIALRPRRTLE